MSLNNDDVNEKLAEITKKEKLDNKSNKEILEMSANLYNVQKEMKKHNYEISGIQKRLTECIHNINSVQIEAKTKQEQANVVKDNVTKTTHEFLEKESELDTLRQEYWGKVNSFVDQINDGFRKREISLQFHEDKCRIDSNELEERNKYKMYLQMKGEKEALEIFKKFQQNQLDALDRVKQIIDNENFSEFN